MSAPKKYTFVLMPEAAGAGAPFLRRSRRPVTVAVLLPSSSGLLTNPAGVRLEDVLRASAAAAPATPATSTAVPPSSP